MRLNKILISFIITILILLSRALLLKIISVVYTVDGTPRKSTKTENKIWSMFGYYISKLTTHYYYMYLKIPQTLI